MALLAPRAADFSAEPGMAVPGVGRPIASLPSLDERIEMFARMVCGPDATVTPEIRAMARDHILTAMAADLVGATMDLASGPQHPNSSAAQLETAQSGTPMSARGARLRTGLVRDLDRLLSFVAPPFTLRRLAMAAVPLAALFVAGSVLTQNWRNGGEPSGQGSTANVPKMRSLEPQSVDTVAEQNLRQVIAADEAAHGRSHPAVARKLVDLASLLRADGRYAEAQALCERALIIQDRDSGAERSRNTPHYQGISHGVPRRRPRQRGGPNPHPGQSTITAPAAFNRGDGGQKTSDDSDELCRTSQISGGGRDSICYHAAEIEGRF